MDGRLRLDRDFSEFIGFLSAHEVRFLVVGSYAVAVHGHPRYTGDLDVWVLVHHDNAERLLCALDDFGFGSVGLTAADFMQPNRGRTAGLSAVANRSPHICRWCRVR